MKSKMLKRMVIILATVLLAIPLYFNYWLEEAVVVVPFGQIGIVLEIGYDQGGPKYKVQTATCSQWWREINLKRYVK